MSNSVLSKIAVVFTGVVAMWLSAALSRLRASTSSCRAEHGFRTRSRFHDMITIAEPVSPLLYSLDTVMGALQVRRWFQNDGLQFLERLLETNAARVQGDVEQRLLESRLRLESEVRRLFREVSATTEQALSKARGLLAAGNAAVNGEVERLRRVGSELEWLSGVS